MAASIDATVGGSSANAYITATEGDSYADERLQASGWSDETDDKKARAIIQATRRIDTLRYEGEKDTTSQALKWPRVDAFDEDGVEYDTDDIPEIVQRATFEAALWLLNQDDASTDPLAPTGLEGFDRAKVGPLDVEINHGQRSGELPDNVVRILRPVLRSVGLVSEMVRS